MRLHLLHFRISHYNEKVRWALDYKGLAHTRETMLPGFHIPRVRFLTGQSKLPVLLIDGQALAGSNLIIEELERMRPTPALIPADPKERARALSIEAYFDREVAPDLRRLFWASYLDQPALCARMAADGFSGGTRAVWRTLLPVMRPFFRRNMGMAPERLKLARDRLGSHFDRLASEIGSAGYLVGDRFGVADLSAAAVMTAIIRPPQFSYPLPEPWPPELAELRASVAEHPACRWVLEVYERHRGTSSERS